MYLLFVLNILYNYMEPVFVFFNLLCYFLISECIQIKIFFFCFRSENDGNTDIEADKVTLFS